MRSNLLVPAAALDALDPSTLDQAGAVTVVLARSRDEVEQSRRHACAFLSGARSGRGGLRRFVQVNDLSSGLTDADLDLVLKAVPDGVVLPGCRSGADVQHLGAKLAVREAEFGIADGATGIIALAGSDPAALFGMETYARSSPRLRGLAWDVRQLASALGVDVGGPADRLPAPIRLGRTLIIVAAHAAGVPAIDTACSLQGAALAAACACARRDGFAGKFAVEASQLPIIDAAFGSAGGPASDRTC